MTRFIKIWITKSESDTEYHWDQETALRSNRETWKAGWKENKDEIILDWRKSIFLNKQYINKEKKQEIRQQKYRIIYDCQRHQENKL